MFLAGEGANPWMLPCSVFQPHLMLSALRIPSIPSLATKHSLSAPTGSSWTPVAESCSRQHSGCNFNLAAGSSATCPLSYDSNPLCSIRCCPLCY